ncbi:related to glutamate carboxypeptidase II [Melanopsichium pennsylvanicum]|uniref:Related to glutamate carboxypeptidase II n=2 Tax=Melanopsichium pennsylvanicum TaxID=63383 RepID=A0AAJ4XN76_9BASI|nr:related to glutamate carboxypeptidase II [Melanopsichium pennsylvanicum 4]SNX85429.1 related to glutamate carboxypeptidase II [Melanopsichium pennsylvanicum]
MVRFQSLDQQDSPPPPPGVYSDTMEKQDDLDLAHLESLNHTDYKQHGAIRINSHSPPGGRAYSTRGWKVFFLICIGFLYAWDWFIKPAWYLALAPAKFCPHASSSLQGYSQHLKSSGFFSTAFSIDTQSSEGPEEKWRKWFGKLESDFLAVPTADGARDALKRYTNVSHVAGTGGDYHGALQILQEWGNLIGAPLTNNLGDLVFDAGSAKSQSYLKGTDEKQGVRAWTDTYAVWLNYPINSSLTLAKSDSLDKPYWTASLKEDVLEQDPTSSRGVPLFHGYSASGSVSGQVVFAGMGRKQDFADLAAKGIDVKGKIALVDYGSNFRGLKVRAAQEAGAVGVIIYTDTIEDGEITEANGYKAYPQGPARNPSAVQRGSVQALSFYPGDPSTPGKPSYRNATRLEPEDADSLPKIPSLPLSYNEAKVLLESMKGKGLKAEDVNSRLAGAIDGVEYWTGPSDDIVHLENFVDLKVRDIWNTYAVLPGHIKDEVVVLGNHRDAWTFGAADPNSGTAAFHEAIKGLSELYKGGWKPMRTIVFASWDAEEYGLVGSTEFGEDYSDWIRDHVVAYHNVDVSVSGSIIKASSSPSLSRLVQNAAAKVDDPNKDDAKIELDAFNPLGSGSDYTVFLQHLGIASTDLGYQRTSTDPVYMYHSNYDSFYWMDKFGDPGFHRHEAAAKMVGLMAIETSTALFAPINVRDYAAELHRYLSKIETLAAKKLGIPKNGGARHPKWLKELRHAVHKLDVSARHFEHQEAHLKRSLVRLVEKHGRHGRHRDHHNHKDAQYHGDEKTDKEIWKVLGEIRRVNKKLQTFEQGLISKEGLKGREWYKHLGTAPGRWLGYGATTFPGVTEAVTLDDGAGLEYEARRLTLHIEGLARHLRTL